MSSIYGYGRAVHYPDMVSTERQRLAFESWCESRERAERFSRHVVAGWTVDGVDADPGTTSWLPRGLATLLRQLQPGDLLVVAYVDLISRDRRELVQFLGTLDLIGASLWEMKSGFTTKTFAGQALVERMRLFEEREGHRHREATAQGRAAVMQHGGTVLSNPPIGWKLTKRACRPLGRSISVLVEDHDERQLAHLVAARHAEGWSHEAIAEQLYEEGVFPRKTRQRTRSRKSKRFGRRQIRNLINASDHDFPQSGSNCWPSPAKKKAEPTRINPVTLLLAGP